MGFIAHLNLGTRSVPDLDILTLEAVGDTRIRAPHNFADHQTRIWWLRDQSFHR